MTVKERIAALREKMRANGIDAYIVFDSDEHMSEYLPEYYRERSWISGFTGSAGTVVVTQQEAGLWTDGPLLPAGCQSAQRKRCHPVPGCRRRCDFSDGLPVQIGRLWRHHCPQRPGGFHCDAPGTAGKVCSERYHPAHRPAADR